MDGFGCRKRYRLKSMSGRELLVSKGLRGGRNEVSASAVIAMVRHVLSNSILPTINWRGVRRRCCSGVSCDNTGAS